MSEMIEGDHHADVGDLRARAMEALRGVIDPEIGLDVVELGLVYELDVDGSFIGVALTMTSPTCPLGEQIVRDAEQRLGALDGAERVAVKLVWDPPWSADRISPGARKALGWED